MKFSYIAAGMLILALLPLATADDPCTRRSIVTVGSTYVDACAGAGTAIYNADTPEKCGPEVPLVTILGEPVPHTGTSPCTPTDDAAANAPWVGWCVYGGIGLAYCDSTCIWPADTGLTCRGQVRLASLP